MGGCKCSIDDVTQGARRAIRRLETALSVVVDCVGEAPNEPYEPLRRGYGAISFNAMWFDVMPILQDIIGQDRKSDELVHTANHSFELRGTQ